MEDYLDKQIKSLEEQRVRAIEIVSQAFGAIQALNVVKNYLTEQAVTPETEIAPETAPLSSVD